MSDDAIGGAPPAPLAPGRRWRRLLVRGASYLLGFTILGWALWRSRDSVHAVMGRRPDLRFLAVAFLLGETALLSTFVRWYLLVRARGIPLGLGPVFRIGFLGHASELIVPGQLGGDVVRAAALYRAQAARTPLIASILFDRVTGVFGLFLLVSLVGAFQWPSAPSGVRRLIEVVWSVTGVGAVGFAALFSSTTAALVQRLLGAGRLQEALIRLWDAAATYRGHPLAVAAALGLAMLSHLIYALDFYAVSCALFPAAPPLASCLLFIPLILFTAIVPLPFGALGVGEGVSDELFRMIGQPIGAPVMLATRVVGLAVSGVSVLVYLVSTPARPRLEAESHPSLPGRPQP